MSTVVKQLQDQAVANLLSPALSTRAGLTAEQAAFIYSRRQEAAPVTRVISEFALRFNRLIDERTVTRYAQDPDRDGTRSGRKGSLPDEVEERIMNIFNILRARGAPFKLSTISHIGRAVLQAHYPALWGRHTLGRRWARNFCKRKGLSYRKATTSRVVSINELVAEGSQFYADIKEFARECAADGTRLCPRLVFNVDEFFVLCLLCEGRSTWTHTRDSTGSVSIPIKDTKAGFSASILTAASGHADLIQLIYKGKTDNVHADIEGSDVLQCHTFGDSHFQTSLTWSDWCRVFLEKIEAIKDTDPDLALVKPVLFIDCASQHYETAMNLPGVKVFAIPPKLTHVFQPADQFIIANLRQKTKEKFGEYLEHVIASTKDWDDPTAAQELTADNAFTRRKKAKLTVGAFRALSPESITGSWVMTGIPSRLFGDQTEFSNDYTVAVNRVNDGDAPLSYTVNDGSASESEDDIDPTLLVNEPGAQLRASKRDRIEGKIAMTPAERKHKLRSSEAYLATRAEAAAAKLQIKQEKEALKAEAASQKASKKAEKQEKAAAAKEEAAKKKTEAKKVEQKPEQKPFDFKAHWAQKTAEERRRADEEDIFGRNSDDEDGPYEAPALAVISYIPRLGLCASYKGNMVPLTIGTAVPVPSNNPQVQSTVPATVPVTQSDNEAE